MSLIEQTIRKSWPYEGMVGIGGQGRVKTCFYDCRDVSQQFPCLQLSKKKYILTQFCAETTVPHSLNTLISNYKYLFSGIDDSIANITKNPVCDEIVEETFIKCVKFSTAVFDDAFDHHKLFGYMSLVIVDHSVEELVCTKIQSHFMCT